jgi:hypothetical protein
MTADSAPAFASQSSQRRCMGRISPPPTPTMITPATVASTAISTGWVTAVAIRTWSSAAITPSVMIRMEAARASSRPYVRPPSALTMRSCAAPPMAEATTMMTIATNALGSQAMTDVSRSLTAFCPQMPNASWSANSRTA